MIGLNVWIIGFILKFIGGLFTFFAALCTFFAVLQNEKHDKVKLWFCQKWHVISCSKFLTLPIEVIKWIKRRKNNLNELLLSYLSFIENKINTILSQHPFIIVYLLLFYFLYFQINLQIFNSIPNSLGVPTFLMLLILFPLLLMSWKKVASLGQEKFITEKVFNNFILVIFIYPYCIICPYILVSEILKLDTFMALLLAIVILPIFWFSFSTPFIYPFSKYIKNPNARQHLLLFIFYATLSLTITLFALWLGKLSSPESWIPQNIQMIISNILFDGVTLVVTFSILTWAISKNELVRIPIAIFVDVIIAAILACCALYFGLIATENALSFQEVINILLGKSQNGDRIELGPYFWAMHTTFLPTVIYLAIILGTWLGKMLLTPIRWFFGKGYEHKNPLALTAALFTLLATIFVLSGLTTDAIEKHINRKSQNKIININD